MATPVTSLLGALALLTPALSHASSSSTGVIEAISPPTGFSELTQPHSVLVDLYSGGQKIGDAIAVTHSGVLRFREPDKVLALLPNVIESQALASSISADLPTNSSKICSQLKAEPCGALSPEVVGIIYDEDHFRVDLFVNPSLLRTIKSQPDVYLAPPAAPLSITSTVGMAMSGSSATSPTYNVQSHTIMGFRNARVRADVSYASKLGVVVDNLVAEMDRSDFRYSAGMFWAPGLDFTGQRRLVGLGIGTQFDTRADREALKGTPLILFLPQQARVEIFVDGRLISSRAYQMGNNQLDTSSLPDGSYSILLRVHESGGAVREERRFFVKNAQIAPIGQPLYFAYAGLLANTSQNSLLNVSDTLYYQVGTAHRLSRWFAFDFSVFGTQDKAIAQAGVWLVTPYARLRTAGLVSTSGDRGALLQVSSASLGRLSFNFDLRRVWSRKGRPLIPLPTYAESFGSATPTGAQLGNGSYTQASGSITYHIGPAYLGVIGSLRRDRGAPADFGIGPSINWPVINRNGLQLTVQADAQKTRTTSTAYAGIRMQFTSGRFSALSTAGRGISRTKGNQGGAVSRAVGGFSGQWQYQGDDRTQMSFAAGLDRSLDSSTVHAGGAIYSKFGHARGDMLKNFEGQGGIQYGLTIQSAAAATRDGVGLGGRDLDESALIVSIKGNVASKFDVLVDEAPRGRVGTGGSLSVFLQPYRRYRVRLRQVDSGSAHYDSATREFTLYPGNVEHVSWRTESLVTVFGNAVRSDGKPISNAAIHSKRGLGQTDEDGFFQIDVSDSDMLAFKDGSGDSCQVRISGLRPQNGYTSLGRVVCQ